MKKSRLLFRSLLLLGLISICVFGAAQDTTPIKKELSALRIEGSIKIDGVLSEAQWSTAEIGTDFIQNEPITGGPPTHKSEVKFLYDDEAVYIGAHLYDSAPDSILRQLSERDNLNNTDFFGVTFDCYRDGINGLEFLVTAAGVQVDTKYGQNNQDGAWNAVWWSAVKITEEGWIVEMKIPYAAIRFPEVEEQKWHLNIFRSVRRNREKLFWNEVNPAVDGFFNQCGYLTGIKNIDPPTRLFFYPYVSAYAENDESQGSTWNSIFNGGADLKFGLSDAYTLDMTLIPDFGQVQSDNQVLNLSPFEVFFDENRQFFTEGTELFSKANLFYSRRIGGRPVGFFDVYGEEYGGYEVVSNPSTARLINATKISGRGQNGLGIGVLNAVSDKTRATVRDTLTGQESQVQTNPLTNYNVFVLDQNLWQNSYVSLVNTSVIRNGRTYDANVTGMEFKLSNKSNSANVNGGAAVSQIYMLNNTDLGYAYSINLDKRSGVVNYGLGQSIESDTYNPNDLGFLFSNNEQAYYGYVGFKQLEPNKRFNRSNVFINLNYSRRYKPDVFTDANINTNFFFQTKNFQAFGGFAVAEPVETYDYFEPRTEGRFYAFPTNYNGGTWISTDYRKRFAIDIEWNYRKYSEKNRQRFNYEISPRFRVNDKLSFILGIGKYNFNNDVGWVNSITDEFDEEVIIFGRRDQDIFEDVLTANYVFNNTMGVSFRARHYWTRVNYLSYKELDPEGYLINHEYAGLEEDGSSSHNANFNAFNIDLVYKWVFSPGSEVSIVWKNSIIGDSNEPIYNYSDNLSKTFAFDQVNSLSVKVLYFLDYRSLKPKSRGQS